MWRKTSKEEKERYKSMSLKDTQRYEEEMKNYTQSRSADSVVEETKNLASCAQKCVCVIIRLVFRVLVLH